MLFLPVGKSRRFWNRHHWNDSINYIKLLIKFTHVLVFPLLPHHTHKLNQYYKTYVPLFTPKQTNENTKYFMLIQTKQNHENKLYYISSSLLQNRTTLIIQLCVFFYKKHFYKEHEAEIREKLKNKEKKTCIVYLCSLFPPPYRLVNKMKVTSLGISSNKNTFSSLHV